jgi:hypothetical protein
VLRLFTIVIALLSTAGACSPAAPERVAPPVVIAAAGDIACDPLDRFFNRGQGTAVSCRMQATSDLLLSIPRLRAVLALGDNQYQDATLEKHRLSYGPTWGRLKAITHPVPGNHEYVDPTAQGYFEYFGPAAGDPKAGYYSFDLGSWHFIALNSECWAIRGCNAGSAQLHWLQRDLAAHRAHCTLAFWHWPRFSSGGSGFGLILGELWEVLYQAGVDVIVNAHDHHYERFAPMDPSGAPDPDRGIRQFIVGTGGQHLTGLRERPPTSQVRDAQTFGVLEMVLRDGSYSWRFIPEPGKSFQDSGNGSCH